MAVYVFLAPIGHTNIIFSICNVVGDWTMLILPCFPNSNAFLVCFCRFYEGINGIQWKSGSPRAAAGTYSLDATQIWRAETWRVEDDDMTHLPEVKKEAPWKGRLKGKVPGSPLHFVQTESHRRDIEVAQDVSTIRKASVWLRIRVEGVPSPCIVWMFHALSATFPRTLDQTALKPTIIFPWSSLVASNFDKFNINPFTCSTQKEDGWSDMFAFVCIGMHLMM